LTSTVSPTPGRVRWVLRRYGWLVLLSVLAFGLLAELQGAAAGRQKYDAEALVVAQQVTTDSAALPSYGEAVFASGEVSRTVAADIGFDGDPDSLIPRRIYVESPPDSIVFVVHGLDENPASAATLANSAAAAFVTELNRPGSGIGVFALQDEASPPSSRDGLPLLLNPLVLGLTTGLVFGLGLLALLLVLKLPVVEEDHLARLLGIPTLGTVRLPKTRRGQLAGSPGVSGIHGTTRRVLDIGSLRIAVMAVPGAGDLATRIAVMLAYDIARRQPVLLVTNDEACQAVSAGVSRTGSVQMVARSWKGDGQQSGDAARPQAPAGVVLVWDRGVLDVDSTHDEEAGIGLLVVPEGYSEVRIRRLRSDLDVLGLHGAVVAGRDRSRARTILATPSKTSPVLEPRPREAED